MDTGLYVPTFGDRATFGDESERPNLWHRLVGLWAPPLGVSGNKLFDVSSHHSHGTLTNMDPASDWVMTEKGWALDFGAGGNDCRVDLTGLVVASTYTMVGVVCSTDSSTDARYLFDSQTGRTLLGWGSDTGGKIGLHDGDAWRLYGNSPSADVWHHLAVVCDGNTSKTRLYVDGELHGIEQNWTPRNLGGTVSLGNRYADWSGQWFGFPGRVALWCIFDRVLALSEIADLYADPFAMLRRRQVVCPSGVNRRRRVLIGAAA